MTTDQAKHIMRLLTDKGVHFDSGLTDDEVFQVETKFDFKFPPDLKLFLQTALPTSDRFVNWRLGLKYKDETDKIIDRLGWPLEGMLFDLQSNEFWINSWGDKPNSHEEKERIARDKYSTFPKLIPIYANRYIPSRPHEEGNPVFSVHQMDIIFYGYDLATYFANEFSFVLTDQFEMLDKPKREIEFWSKWVDEWTEN
jgi:hypothetical protein